MKHYNKSRRCTEKYVFLFVKKSISFSGPFPTLQEVEDYFISKAIKRTDGIQAHAAKLLGISESALSRRLSKANKKKGIGSTLMAKYWLRLQPKSG